MPGADITPPPSSAPKNTPEVDNGNNKTPTTPTPVTVPRGTVTADLEYLLPTEDGAKPYYYVEDAVAVQAGRPRTNLRSAPSPTVIEDVRGREEQFSLDQDAFEAVTLDEKDASNATRVDVPAADDVDFYNENSIVTKYYDEVTQLLLSHLPGAKRVLIFDHTIRRPTTNRTAVYAAHVDQTPRSTVWRVRSHVATEQEEKRKQKMQQEHEDQSQQQVHEQAKQEEEEDEAAKLLQGRVRLVNVWRPLNGPVVESPLALTSGPTVSEDDLVASDLLYANRHGETYRLKPPAGAASQAQPKWYYWSGMSNQERLLIKCADLLGGVPNTEVPGLRSAHTAFPDPRTPAGAPGRESIEVRTLVFG